VKPGVVTNETGVGEGLEPTTLLSCANFAGEAFEGPGFAGVEGTVARLLLALSCRLSSSASCASASVEDED
jgi:hypothetical protein